MCPLHRKLLANDPAAKTGEIRVWPRRDGRDRLAGGLISASAATRTFLVAGTTSLLALAACTKREPALPAASGSFSFEPAAMMASATDGGATVDMTDTILATETEVVRSEPVIRAAVRNGARASALALSEDQTVDRLKEATTAKRRGKSLVLDVTVRLSDVTLAKSACNAIVRAYVDYRSSRHIVAGEMREEWLQSELEKIDASAPIAAVLRAEAAAQDVENHRNDRDVTVIDTCTATR